MDVVQSNTKKAKKNSKIKLKIKHHGIKKAKKKKMKTTVYTTKSFESAVKCQQEL